MCTGVASICDIDHLVLREVCQQSGRRAVAQHAAIELVLIRRRQPDTRLRAMRQQPDRATDFLATAAANLVEAAPEVAAAFLLMLAENRSGRFSAAVRDSLERIDALDGIAILVRLAARRLQDSQSRESE